MGFRESMRESIMSSQSLNYMEDNEEGGGCLGGWVGLNDEMIVDNDCKGV